MIVLGTILLGWFLLYGYWRFTPSVALVPAFGGERFKLPVMLREFPNYETFAIVEKSGKIRWITKVNPKLSGIMLDISDRVFSESYEEGLLSVAFDPEFSKNRYYYVFYSLENPIRSRVSRFELKTDLTTDASKEAVLLEFPKLNYTHNGGLLEFGPDGYLYISVGDSNIRSIEKEREILQSRETFLGSILRIDPSKSEGEKPYSIPLDNPFAGEKSSIKREIWAYGFRNPWRFSFDQKDGVLFANDVGGGKYEEVNRVQKGANYGWPLMEGEGCRFSKDHGRCDKEGKTLPMARFAHRDKITVTTGGIRYRGRAVPNLNGKYVMADMRAGLLVFEPPRDGGVVRMPTWLHPPFEVRNGFPIQDKKISVTSLDQDHNGEIYVVTRQGRIYQIAEQEADDYRWLKFLQSMFEWKVLNEA